MNQKNESRFCIICGEVKSIKEFNKEHLFPDTIGGTLTTDKVCIDCNTKLNENVDEPFVKSNFVLKYRHDFQLKKDARRSIPQIVKGPVIGPNGDKTFVKYENGQFKPEILDKRSHEFLEKGGLEVKLTIDASKMDMSDEIIKHHLKSLSKELDMDLTAGYVVKNVEKNDVKSFDLKISAPNKYLIRECIKIAYEIVVMLQPLYYEDPMAKNLISYLVTNTISVGLSEELNLTGVGKYKEYYNRFSLFRLELYQHAILIETIPSDGIYVVIKIFDYIYPIKMSANTELLLPLDLLLINDILAGIIDINYGMSYTLQTIQPELRNVDSKIREEVKLKGIAYFQLNEDSMVFYKSDGSIKYDNLNSLCHETIIKEKLFLAPLEEILTLDLSKKNLYVKSCEDMLIQLNSISIQRQMRVIPLPK